MSRRVQPLLTVAAASCFLCLVVPTGAAAAGAAAGTWSIQPSPDPVGATSAWLSSVSCPSEQACQAVGGSVSGSPPPGTGQVGLAEGWDGTQWTIEPVADPGSSDTVLNAVSCTTSTSCTAVGYTVDPFPGSVRSLAETWNGTSWQVVPTPQPAKSSWTVLEAISCPNASGCVAVGGQIGPSVDSQEAPMAMIWAGGKWRLLSATNPHAENGSELESVSCITLGSCQAVAGYTFADVGEGIFAEGWNGRHWALEQQPNPGNEEYDFEVGVACTTSARCLSVGNYGGKRGTTAPLVQSWDGSSWTYRAVPTPEGDDIAELYGVSCAAPASCEAVGDQADNFEDLPSTTFAGHWDGGSWSIEMPANPAGAESSTLSGISCPGPSLCVAVGGSDDSSVTTTLVEDRTSSG